MGKEGPVVLRFLVTAPVALDTEPGEMVVPPSLS